MHEHKNTNFFLDLKIILDLKNINVNIKQLNFRSENKFLDLKIHLLIIQNLIFRSENRFSDLKTIA